MSNIHWVTFSDMGPLYPFGPLNTKDIKLMDREAQTGRQVDLFTWFPYYGGKYNYTVVSDRIMAGPIFGSHMSFFVFRSCPSMVT